MLLKASIGREDGPFVELCRARYEDVRCTAVRPRWRSPMCVLYQVYTMPNYRLR